MQITVELAMSFCCVEIHRKVTRNPGLSSAVERARKDFFRRPNLIFMLSYMITCSIGFWPHCHTCRSPYVCLLFHECLKTGSFDVQGVNSCREHFNNSAFLTNGLLDLQERNGMNATSFG